MLQANGSASADTLIQTVVRENVGGLAVGIVILAAGFTTLAALRLRMFGTTFRQRLARFQSKAQDRAALWFGFFAEAYGVRQLAKNRLFDLAFPLVPWDSVVAWLDFLIPIPAFLLAKEFYGTGWRSSLLWLVRFLVAYAVAGIGGSLVTGRPYAIPQPGGTVIFVSVLVVLLVDRLHAYRPPPLADAPVLVSGSLVFLVFVLNANYGPQAYRGWEPLGLLIFMAGLGWVVVRRSVRNEQKLFAMEEEMAAARSIQSSILPASEPQAPGVRICARYSPVATVAGDFFDFVSTESQGLGILVADVTGHGVPAALIASMVKVALASQQAHATDPARVISGLNQIFCKQLSGQFITAAYLYVDPGGRSVTYCAAAHPPLLVHRKAAASIERHQSNGLLLGFRPTEAYSSITIPVSPGDRLLLYTDGLIEAENPDGETFGSVIDRYITSHANLPQHLFADALLADLAQWLALGSEYTQEDDLTLVVIDVEPSGSEGVATGPLQSQRHPMN